MSERSAGVTQRRGAQVHQRWARLRFSVIGQLLAAPPPKGALYRELEKLAAREWRHPVSGEPVRFGVSTIERWYYRARRERHDRPSARAPTECKWLVASLALLRQF
jgi:putative transposase